MKVTLSVKRNRNPNFASAIVRGATAGLQTGGQMMADAVKASITDMARYPTGELAGTVVYEDQNGDSVIAGRVVASGDHAQWFEQGAAQHFVSINSVDWRVIGGLYDNAIPVYSYQDGDSTIKPSGSYKGNTVFDMHTERVPIGYLISSSAHPFMEEGFTATKDTLVQEVANRIVEALEMNS